MVSFCSNMQQYTLNYYDDTLNYIFYVNNSFIIKYNDE